MTTITKEYVYTENGSGHGTFFDWGGNNTWTITFPVAIKNVQQVDFSVMSGVNVRNTTARFDGNLRFFAYNESWNLVGSRSTTTIRRSTSKAISSVLQPIEVGGATVKYIKIMGHSNSGPNLILDGVQPGITTYNIVSEVHPVTMDVLYIGSTTLSILVQGDPDAEYVIISDKVVFENVKSGEILNLENLSPNTDYEIHAFV